MSQEQGYNSAYTYDSFQGTSFHARAVFSDESPYFRTPNEPRSGDLVSVRIRTLRDNVDQVFLISGSRREQLTRAFSRGAFDFYEIYITVERETLYYYFELRKGEEVYYYNKMGISRDLAKRNSFRLAPNFSTPAWAKGAVMYQIYTDRFCNGDPTNDVLTREYYYIDDYSNKVTDWNQPPENMDVRNFYGGDLEGVLQKLDYLKELGVEVIYLNPIFVSPSNHKYDIQDYDHVDPHLGRIVCDGGNLLEWGDHDNSHASRFCTRVTESANLNASDDLLADLIAEIHKRGMRLILDGVFNHCGSFNKWMDRERIYVGQEGYEPGAYVDASSPYHSFFKFNNEHAWPNNEFYEGWWNHKTLPKLNYEESPALVEYILHVGRKWVSAPYCADGWRLDVAADLGYTREYNHSFWKRFRTEVKQANPDAIILAEHYGNASEWLEGDEWDTVMNYDAFMEPVSWFLTGMEKHSDAFDPTLLGNGEAFASAMRYHLASFMGPSLMCAMNELDNHDHSRFLTRTNHRVGRVQNLGWWAAGQDIEPAVLREAVLIQMTFIGAPTIYYGDEAGVVGFTDPDNRRTYPWGNEDHDLLAFYRAAIALHKGHEAFRDGSIKDLGCGYQYVSYGRFTDTEQLVCVVNSADAMTPVELPVWETGIPREGCCEMEEVFVTDKWGYGAGGERRQVHNGILTLDLRPYEAVVLRNV